MKTSNVQSPFLNQTRREGQTVTVITTNGYQQRGRILSFDRYVVALETDRGQALVFKHAISTIVPERPLTLFGDDGDEAE